MVNAMTPKELKNSSLFLSKMSQESPSRINNNNGDINFIDDESLKHMSKE